MGGLNTAQESYFGFRVDPYCTGTVAECLGNASTLSTNLLNFIKNGAFSFFTPIIGYDPTVGSLVQYGAFQNILREGSANINMVTSLE